MADRIDVKIGNVELCLLARGGVYWPSHETLFVADTHFGKEATFRRAGIPIPRGSTDETLTRISTMLRGTDASQLVILGDMFHTRTSISSDVSQSMDQFFSGHDILVTLVRGNHDAHVGRLPENWPVDVIDPGKKTDRVVVSHFPSAVADNVELQLCGHIHPAVRLSSSNASLGVLPCFWRTGRNLVLPALGTFTGTHCVRPRYSDSVWVIAENEIFQHGFSAASK